MNKLQQKLDHLAWLKTIGVEYYCSDEKDSKNSLNKLLADKKQAKPKKTAKQLIEPPIPQQPKQSAPKLKEIKKDTHDASSSRELANRATSLDELKNIIENFDGCELKNFATNTVFADGTRGAPILLVGEAPGAKEDEEGIPFCGESGILLDKMLEAIGLSRKNNVYITNTIFWRPPANRRPTSSEIAICRPFVEKHIALAKPKLIILVGSTAITSLLGKEFGISEVRQEIHQYQNEYLDKPISTTAIFHPAYLLRQPMQKKTTWYDLLKIKDFIETI
jgi:DNA polymerase